MENRRLKMNKMVTMPGFTAERSLAYAQGRFLELGKAVARTGTVQPALRRDFGLPCLKFDYDCDDGPCHWVATIGHVGPFGCQ
jgi:hypothetical protein